MTRYASTALSAPRAFALAAALLHFACGSGPAGAPGGGPVAGTSNGKFTLTVDSAAIAAKLGNTRPSAGNKYLTASITLQNSGEATPLSIDWSLFSLADSSGLVYRSSGSNCPVRVTIGLGAQLSCTFDFELPAAAAPAKLIYADGQRKAQVELSGTIACNCPIRADATDHLIQCGASMCIDDSTVSCDASANLAYGAACTLPDGGTTTSPTCWQVVNCEINTCSNSACVHQCGAGTSSGVQALVDAMNTCLASNCPSGTGGVCADLSSSACHNCEGNAAQATGGPCHSQFQACLAN